MSDPWETETRLVGVLLLTCLLHARDARVSIRRVTNEGGAWRIVAYGAVTGQRYRVQQQGELLRVLEQAAALLKQDGAEPASGRQSDDP